MSIGVSSAAEIAAHSIETKRYKPYAQMYNDALAKLEQAPDLPLREAASHDLRLSRADPLTIRSNFSGTGESLGRKPDFVRTSKDAAKFTHAKGDFWAAPGKAFTWSQVLSCEEMKAFKGGLSPDAQKIVNGNKFADIGEAHEIPWNDEFDFPEDPTLESVSQVTSSTKSGSKRGLSEALGEGASSNKKPRLDSIAAVSSTGTNRTPPPKDKDTGKNVDARVQLGTYAMEQLSSGPGVVHVIGTLVVGTLSGS